MAKGKKTGGRTKGTPNRDSGSVAQYLETMNCEPTHILADIAMGKALHCRLSFNDETGDFVEGKLAPTLDQRMTAAKTLLEYIAPKLKSVEHAPASGLKSFTLTVNTGEDG